MKFCFLIITFLFLNLPIDGMPLPQGNSSILIQVSEPLPSEDLEYLKLNQFTQIESLNLEKTLYKLTYRNSDMNAEQALSKIYGLKRLLTAQEDTRVSFRSTVPNDSFFDQQWHLKQIHADLAWDAVKSGVNRRGDTIVIAVVDDGLHTNHPDFQGNIWINYADTINNGKDDDNNGYVDDTYGWNFQSNNNDISDSNYYLAKHGTPIAGIIGAVTNNGKGVSGIMWKVKLMIVNIADTGDFPQSFQSDVIRAYSYILHQRKLYEQTNGNKGAFVVVENSSFGVDNRKAFQAPLWCAFYDTLGKYGILSVSSVANSSIDVDVTGDLPTLCTSEHLITVASNTKGDNYGGCGYSTVSVDLSAPGYNIFTTAPYLPEFIQTNNVYKSGYSGTSFSAPMVTAAIGLLHTYACERVLDSIKKNPAKGNLILRKMILEGVDQLPTYAGKSVSGGRLNIKKSMSILNSYCLGDVGIKETEALTSEVTIYPNPSNRTNLTVSATSEILSVQVFDLSGREMTCVYADGKLEVQGLNAGVYLIQVKTAMGTSVVRFLNLSNQ
ncbi:MAG TPA: S8 family peptidase [Bacteroidia bacterium]